MLSSWPAGRQSRTQAVSIENSNQSHQFFHRHARIPNADFQHLRLHIGRLAGAFTRDTEVDCQRLARHHLYVRLAVIQCILADLCREYHFPSLHDVLQLSHLTQRRIVCHSDDFGDWHTCYRSFYCHERYSVLGSSVQDQRNSSLTRPHSRHWSEL